VIKVKLNSCLKNWQQANIITANMTAKVHLWHQIRPTYLIKMCSKCSKWPSIQNT